MSPYRGYDIFFPDVGVYVEMHCMVCGAKCEVQRDCNGPTNFLEAAMSKTGRKHDKFTCPHSGLDWHENIIKLLKEYADTKSKRIRSLIAQDIEDELDFPRVTFSDNFHCPMIEVLDGKANP